LTLSSVLENVARELEILARKAHQIDEAMGDAICAGDSVDSLPLALTQDVDLMRQSADCLHILLSNLARITTQIDTLATDLDTTSMTQGVYLSGMRSRVGASVEMTSFVSADRGDWLDL
jgi:hypothetical protein